MKRKTQTTKSYLVSYGFDFIHSIQKQLLSCFMTATKQSTKVCEKPQTIDRHISLLFSEIDHLLSILEGNHSYLVYDKGVLRGNA